MPWRSTRAMKSRGVYRASADLAKCGLRDTKFSAVAVRLVKLQRPPPEIGILRAIRGLCSSTTTRPPPPRVPLVPPLFSCGGGGRRGGGVRAAGVGGGGGGGGGRKGRRFL